VQGGAEDPRALLRRAAGGRHGRGDPQQPEGDRGLSRQVGGERRGRGMSAPILEVDGIDVFYGASQILFDVSLTVETGQSMALLGRNGAGKSTTMKAIIGLAPPRKGAVRVRGEAVQGRSPDSIARSGIGYVPEDRQVFP